MAKSIDGKLLTPSVATESVLNLLHKKVYLMYDLASNYISEDDYAAAKDVVDKAYKGRCEEWECFKKMQKTLEIPSLARIIDVYAARLEEMAEISNMFGTIIIRDKKSDNLEAQE